MNLWLTSPEEHTLDNISMVHLTFSHPQTVQLREAHIGRDSSYIEPSTIPSMDPYSSATSLL